MSAEDSSATRLAAIDSELATMYGRLAALHGERAGLALSSSRGGGS